MRRFRGLAIGAGATLALGMAGCGNGAPIASTNTSGGPSCPGSAGVNVGSPAVKVAATDQLVFAPVSQSAKVGQVIQWTNTGTVLHTITFDSDPCLTDGSIVPGGTWEVKVTKPGTYHYICTIHAPGMVGTLTVTG